MRLRRLSFFVCVVCVLLLGVTSSQAAEPGFQEGDLVLNSDFYGDLQWLRADGTPVQPLETGDHFASGAEFDPSGRLWVVEKTTDKAYLFNNHGEFVGTIVEDIQDWPDQGNGYQGNPTDISFDAKGNAYIGSFEDEGPITKFSPSGESLGVLLDWEADHLDLSADQCTLYFLKANGGLIFRKNLCTDGSIYRIPPDYAPSDPSESFGLRILPDGSLLVALPPNAIEDGDSAVARIDDDGHVLRLYDTPECASGGWAGIALSPDASSFWSSCYIWNDPAGPYPVEFDVASGAVVRALSTPGIVQAVYGGFRASQDRTDPTVSITSPTHGAVYALGQPVVADYSCADTGGSDLASCIGNVPDGGAVNTASVGAKTLTVTAKDGAGNTAATSASYNVIYNFSGYEHPVDNPPTFNVMAAGKGVKLIFKLAGNQGLNIFETGYPAVSAIPCGTPQDNVEKTVKVSQSKLSYEAKPQQYVYYWATNNTWRASCREIVLKLKDGTEHRALFKFT